MSESSLEWKQQIVALKDVNFADLPDWFTKVLLSAAPAPTNRKQVVALSGGKDSTAMALALSFFEPARYTFVCTPTGNELPEMFAHWLKIGEMLGSPLLPVSRQSLFGLIKKQRALPNHRARWCTRILKLEEYYRWLADQTPCISYVGLRADEEGRTGMVFPDADGVLMDFPMRRWGWTMDDVLAFLQFLSVTIPERTDCAVCFWQKLGEWYLLWRDHLDQFMAGENIELWVQEERGEAYTLRSAQRDSWPAGLRELRLEFEKGRIPTRSLMMMDKRRLVGACRACTL